MASPIQFTICINECCICHKGYFCALLFPCKHGLSVSAFQVQFFRRLVLLFILYALISFLGFQILHAQENSITDSLNALLKHTSYKSDLLIELASEYQYITPSKALKTASEALETAKQENNETAQAYAYYHIASNYLTLGNYDTCKRLLQQAEVLFNKLHLTEGLLSVANARANIEFLRGNLNNALKMFQDILRQSRAKNHPRTEVASLINIGRIAWLKGIHDTALQYYSEALQKADSMKSTFMTGIILLLTGIVYQDMGYYELAASRMLEAARIFEKMNYRTKLPYAYNYLGLVFFELQDNEKAIYYLEKAQIGLTEAGDYWGVSIAHRFLGRTHRRLHRYDSAEVCFKKSLSVAEKLNDINGKTSSLRFLGEVYLDKNQLDKANKVLLESLDKANVSNDLREKTNVLTDLGILASKTGQYPKAFDLMHQASFLADSLDLFYESMMISKQLSEMYEKTGDFGNSLLYFKKYKSLNDSVNSSARRRNIEELQIQYETEKKNSEIAYLNMQKKVQEAKLRNQRMLEYSLSAILLLFLLFLLFLWISYRQKLKANAEKEILLREIHHRVKNNLQTISSLLSLQSYSLDDTKVKNAVRESQERVKAMALIHQMLYQQEKLSVIDFGEYLKKLAESIASGFETPETTISCTIHCDTKGLDVDTAIVLGLIANELLINAYKYAFQGRTNGNIMISLTRNTQNKCLFRIKDNGIGIPPHATAEKAGTLGLRLVSLLVRQLRGHLSLSTNEGTEFVIVF